jgi:ABC-type antimicrobial peptide transport system permease subunit
MEARNTPIYSASLLIRTTGDPLGFIDRVRRIAEQNEQRMSKGELLEDRLTAAIATRRFELQLFVVFASVSVLLAAVGLYGVLNYAVTDRTCEFGVRIAVGASTMDILRAVMTQGLRLALAGVILGSIASFLFTRWMQSMLFGVTFTDPVVFISVCGLMLAVAVLAAWIPAIRATRVDPAVALRHD